MSSALELMSRTGARILELDSKVDLRQAKQTVGKRVCLMGNLSPVAVLLQGSPTEAEHAATRRLMRQEEMAVSCWVLGARFR